MPLQLTRTDRKILITSACVLVALIAAALLLARGTDSDNDIPSAYSRASGGCKAAYLLLQESGYHVETWQQPLRDLPEGNGKTLIILQPATFPAQEERQKLQSFLETGGQLIAAGRFAGFYLPRNESIPDPARGPLWQQYSALSLSPITHLAPKVTMGPQAYWRPDTSAVGLYGETDKPVVVEYKIGEGRVLWLADPTPLTNAGLKQPDNMEFLLAAVEAPGQNQILWDEFVHGYERAAPAGKGSRMAEWIGLQLALFAIAILLTYSRRSGPVWIPEAEARLSPLEFVRTLGGLYEHAGAGGVAVDIFHQRFRYLLTRRLGLSINSSVDDLSRTVRDRGVLPDTDFAKTLSECESCRYDPNVLSSTALRLVQDLFDYSVRFKLIRAPERENKTWKPS